MAVVLVDSFDAYNGTGANTGLQAKWTGVATTRVSMQAGRFTGQAVRLNSQNNASVTGQVFRSFPGSYTAYTIGFAFRIDALGSITGTNTSNIIAQLTDSAGTFQVGLAVAADGSLVAYRLTGSNSGTQLGSASAAGVIPTNTWVHIQWSGTIDDATGTFVVKVNNATALNLSSQDTRNGTPTTVNRIYFTQIINVAAADTNNVWIDDLYVQDSSTPLGERRIETLYPTSDVAQGFSRSTGSTNFSLVDEAQVNGDTDYVQASSVGTVDTYGFGDLTGTPATIDAVQFSAFAEKTDATSRSIALQMKSGATTSDGSDFSLASSYGKFERLQLLDPNGSIAWTTANVNALTGGPKVTV